MANLTGQQIQNTYGNVVTVGTAGGSPQTGTITNGAGLDLTAVTINGDLTCNNFNGNLTGNVTGNVNGNLTGNVTGDVTGNVTSAGTSTFSGTVELNGATVNNASFDLTGNVTGNLNGNVTGNVTGDLTGNVSGATTIAGTTVNATTVNATTLTGSGINISQLPSVRVEWSNGSPAYFNLTNGADNHFPWNSSGIFPTSAGTTYFELINTGTSAGLNCARIHIKFAGVYMFRAGIHLYDLYNNVDVLVKLQSSGVATGGTPTDYPQGLLCDGKFAEVSADQQLYGSKILNIGANYYTVAVNPSANSPFPSDANNGRSYFEILKLS